MLQELASASHPTPSDVPSCYSNVLAAMHLYQLISSNSWCQNSCVRPSSRSTSRARYWGLPHFPMIVPVSPRHSERSPDSSPTLTIAPITACCDLIRNSCLNHPFRPCQAPYLTTIAGERLLNVTTTVTSKNFRDLL